MRKTTTLASQLPQPTWRRHFEPLLFLIHCANAIWIGRIFMINYKDMSGNYFFDIYFVSGFVCAFLLNQMRWRIYLNKSLNKNYELLFELKKDVIIMLEYIFGSIPYLIKVIPSNEILEKTIENFRGKNCNLIAIKTNFDLLKIVMESKKIILSHAFFIFGAFYFLFSKIQPEGIKILLYGDWRIYSLFHVLVMGMLIYSILFVLNFILKRK